MTSTSGAMGPATRLSTRLPGVPWRLLALALYVAVQVRLLIHTVPSLSIIPMDWHVWARVPEAMANGTLYDPTAGHFPWIMSPVMAPVMAGVALAGYPVFVALHFAAVTLLRDWRLIGLVLVTAAFWTDVAATNVFTFVFVAGVLALRGSRWGTLAYLALFLLMPRPVQLPLAVWLLWQRPELRMPFGVMFAVHGIAVLLTGYAGDWLYAMTSYGIRPAFNLGPTAWLGLWWMALGIPLAVVLARRGWVGLAGLAITPYLLTHYLLVLLWDLRSPLWRPPDDVAEDGARGIRRDLLKERESAGRDGEADGGRSGVPSPLHTVLTHARRESGADTSDR